MLTSDLYLPFDNEPLTLQLDLTVDISWLMSTSLRQSHPVTRYSNHTHSVIPQPPKWHSQHIERLRPVILDEAFESPETAALRYEEGYDGGLLARADSPPGFLPMSAYGKPLPQSHGFGMNRSFSDSYSAAPIFAPQPAVTTINTQAYHNAPLMAPMDYVGQSHVPYDDQTGPYLNVGATPIPQVTSYRPSRGVNGTRMDVYISSLYDLATSNIPTFFLMFASRKCAAAPSKLDQQGGVCQYVITADVPDLASTGWQSSQVPVYLLIESADGELMGKVDVGGFTYLEDSLKESNTVDVSRKRKVSLDTELTKPSAKRSSSNQVRHKEELASYNYMGATDASFSPYLQPSPQYNMVPQYNRSSGQYQSQPLPRPMSQQFPYPNSSTSHSPSIKAHSPQVSGWVPYAAVGSHISPSPGVGASTSSSSRPTISGLPSPLQANPSLIRTSTLQQTPSPAATPAGAQQSGQPFNPYTLYPHKAVLKIAGELDSMTENWTVDEWSASRRIVMFKRSQSGCTITTTFSPVTLDERPPNSICISCIFWEDKNECFVTSVDTIYLLEQLVAARFTVEEKNRIRRNLEGFKPATVSKAKPDSEEFFKLIMGFPSPKPRNIEKDVKVFPWKILPLALKKIIGKYSASPSSTLPPAMLTPSSSTGYATEGPPTLSHSNSDHNITLSPRSNSRSISGTSASTAYAMSGPSKILSPPTTKRHLTVKSGGSHDLRFSMPNYDQPSEQTHQWEGSQQHMQPTHYQQIRGGNVNTRNSWDGASYLDASPVSMATSVAAGHGSRLSGNYNSRDMAGSSRLSLSEGDANLRVAQQSSQQVPSS